MKVLGIETSCDETGVALVQASQVVATRIATQEVHARWGGVVPELASRLHQKTLSRMVDEIMQDSGWSFSELDGIAVTYGPGLIGALLVGVSYAKGLAVSNHLPFIGVNHLEGHLWASAAAGEEMPLPALAVLVSGGHTELIHILEFGRYEYLGGTLDDAAGEAFDKVGGLLGLAYPAGAQMGRLAEKGNPKRFRMPVAVTDRPLDFSFSGLKTAALREVEQMRNESGKEWKADLAASFQVAVVKQLTSRIELALKQVEAKSLILGGGVAANKLLRKKAATIANKAGIRLIAPPSEWCTDNGAMIAWLGARKLAEQGSDPLTLEANPNLELTGEMA